MTANKVYVPQIDINAMIEDLANHIKSSERKFDLVVGIENGGVYISRPLAELFSLPHASVKINRYDGEHRRPNIIIYDNGFRPEGRTCLVVDDLIDDGGTMLAYGRHFGIGSNDAIAVLFWSGTELVKPDFYCLRKPKEWIVFPWETKTEVSSTV
jgi:hypoxanthine phosphoribosyltransferase